MMDHVSVDLTHDFIKAFESVFESFNQHVRAIYFAFVFESNLVTYIFSISPPIVIQNILSDDILAATNFCLLYFFFTLVVL